MHPAHQLPSDEVIPARVHVPEERGIGEATFACTEIEHKVDQRIQLTLREWNFYER